MANILLLHLDGKLPNLALMSLFDDDRQMVIPGAW